MKGFLIIALAALLLIGGGLTACSGTQIKSGQVGVRVVELGSDAGVQAQELGVGWYWPQWGSYVLKFPTTVRTEVWADSQDGSQQTGGPAIQFNNADGVATRVAVSIQLRVDPGEVSRAVQRYRLGFADMIDGPVRRRLQDAFVRLGSRYTSEQLVSGEGATLLTDVHNAVRAPLEAEGLVIENIALVGAFALPESIRERINNRVEAEQNAETQRAQVAVSQAQAQQRIAQAEGEARAIELLGAALRANPQVLRQREIERWNGTCPLDTNTCVIGSSALVGAGGE